MRAVGFRDGLVVLFNSKAKDISWPILLSLKLKDCIASLIWFLAFSTTRTLVVLPDSICSNCVSMSRVRLVETMLGMYFFMELIIAIPISVGLNPDFWIPVYSALFVCSFLLLEIGTPFDTFES